jgi:coenzyme PQQ synthesis protein D (PqqD)
VVFRELEGEAVLLSLQSGTYFGLNEVGTRIWALIKEHRSLRSVFEMIQQEYEVSPKTLESDLLRLVEELHAKGLVSVSQASGQKGSASSRQ